MTEVEKLYELYPTLRKLVNSGEKLNFSRERFTMTQYNNPALVAEIKGMFKNGIDDFVKAHCMTTLGWKFIDASFRPNEEWLKKHNPNTMAGEKWANIYDINFKYPLDNSDAEVKPAFIIISNDRYDDIFSEINPEYLLKLYIHYIRTETKKNVQRDMIEKIKSLTGST